MKALTKSVEDRYQSASAMRADIERFLAGKPVVAPVVPVPNGDPVSPDDVTSIFGGRPDDEDDEPERKKRWPLIATILGVIALLALAVVIGPMLFSSAAGREDRPAAGQHDPGPGREPINEAGLTVGHRLPGGLRGRSEGPGDRPGPRCSISAKAISGRALRC